MNWLVSLILTILMLRVVAYMFWYLDQNAGQMKMLTGNPARAFTSAVLGLFAFKTAQKNAAAKKERLTQPQPVLRARRASEVWDKGPGFAMS